MKKRTIGIVIAVIVVSLLLSAALSIGALLYIRQDNVEETGNVLGVSWYNETDTEFTISTVEQLREFAKLSNFYTFEDQTIYLDADLVLNEGNAADWATTPPANRWSPIAHFAGTFDGQGHTISGLYARAYDAPMAMFTNVDTSATVRDIKLVNSYFNTRGGSGVASFVSNGGGKFYKLYSEAIFDHGAELCGGIGSRITKQATFQECWFNGTINAKQRKIGGLVDNVGSPRVEFKHCLFSGTINQNMMNMEPYHGMEGTRTGGLVGTVEPNAGAIYTDCLSSGTIKSSIDKYVGSVTGVADGGSNTYYTNTYASADSYNLVVGSKGGTHNGAAVPIAGKDLIGVEAYRWTELDFTSFWTIVDNGTPQLRYFAETVQTVEGVEKEVDTSWFVAGESTSVIMNRAQLIGFYYLGYGTNFSGKTIKLGADIVMNEGKASDWATKAPKYKWHPIGEDDTAGRTDFAGIFDGQGHTISGLYMNETETQTGLFGHTALGSMVRNTKIVNSYITSTAQYVGTFIGHAYGNMHNLYSEAIIEAKVETKGIIGYGGIAGITNNFTQTAGNKQTVSNCWFNGEIIINGSVTGVGGILGAAARYGKTDGSKLILTIDDCLNTGVIRSNKESKIEGSGGTKVGGILGYDMMNMNIYMNNCLHTGKIDMKATTEVGAILGHASVASSLFAFKNVYTTESATPTTAKNVAIGKVVNESKTTSGPVVMKDEWLTGKTAAQYTHLDYKDIWTVVNGSTPVLRSYAKKTQNVGNVKKLADISWYDDSKEVMVIDSVEDLYGFYLMSAFDGFQGQTVKLGKDIVVNEGNAADWATTAPAREWLPMTRDVGFTGTFDGNGHAIKGLYINQDTKHTGLFGHTFFGSAIKNLRLENSYITSTSTHVGSIVGHAYGGTLDKVYSNAIVETTGKANSAHIGGIVGVDNYYTTNYTKTAAMYNCWFDGEIKLSGGESNVGGLVGYTTGYGGGATMYMKIDIAHSLFTGTISGENGGSAIGGLVGEFVSYVNLQDSASLGTIDVKDATNTGAVAGKLHAKQRQTILANVYTTEKYCPTTAPGISIGWMSNSPSGGVALVPNEWMIGNSAYQYTSLDFTNYWTVVENDTPILRCFASNPITSTGPKILDLSWYYNDSDAGSGRGDLVFEIETPAELYGFAYISQSFDFANKTVWLKKDINLNEGKASDWVEGKNIENLRNWTMIGQDKDGSRFAGTFNGGGHTISGVYCNYPTSTGVGLFASTLAGSEITNVKLTNSCFIGKDCVAGVAAKMQGLVSYVYTDAFVKASAGTVGGIAGDACCAIEIGSKSPVGFTNCWFDGTITAKGTAVAGIAGKFHSEDNITLTMEDCLVTGKLTNTQTGNIVTGGLIGYSTQANVNITRCLVAPEELNLKSTRQVGMVAGNLAKPNLVNPEWNIKDTYYQDSDNKYKSIGATNKLFNVTDDSIELAKEKVTLDDVPALKASTAWAKDANNAPILSFEGAKEPVILTHWYYDDDDAYGAAGDGIFRIDTVEGFYEFGEISQGYNFAGKTVYLDADLVLNEGKAEDWVEAKVSGIRNWTPIGLNQDGYRFAGTFNGNGHTISGLYCSGREVVVGLFKSTLEGSEVTNFKLVNSYVVGPGYVGSIAGKCQGRISNVYSDAIVQGTNVSVGGIVGETTYNLADTTKKSGFSNCWFDGEVISSSARVGGITGSLYSNGTALDKITLKLEDCLMTGKITSRGSGDVMVGGLIGYTSRACVEITRCLMAGEITAQPGVTSVGTLAGHLRDEDQTYSSKWTIKDTYIDDAYATIGTKGAKYSVSDGSKRIPHETVTFNNVPALKANAAWTSDKNGAPILSVFADWWSTYSAPTTMLLSPMSLRSSSLSKYFNY